MEENKEICKGRVWGGWSSHQCSKKAWKDSYCKIHHPEEIKRREKGRDEKRKIEDDRRVDAAKETQNRLWNEVRDIYNKYKDSSHADFIDVLKEDFKIFKKSKFG